MNNNNHHYMAIEMNNQTWSLLDKKDRSEQDKEFFLLDLNSK